MRLGTKLVCHTGAALAVLGAALPAWAENTLDRTPRTAVMSAYQPEWEALQAALTDRAEHVVNGTTFLTGVMKGKPVVLFLTGVSMVNAAMTSQVALDRFVVRRIVFSGIAGGVDPRLAIGDVVVPAQWSQYLEVAFARETGDGYALPPFLSKTLPNFGMMFPQPVAIARAGAAPEMRQWFPADPALLAQARKVAEGATLARCTAQNACLVHAPKVVVGGNGVSGQAFVDNANFRAYAQQAFGAQVLDMESAAVAHVAYANATPFIAFRSLSDLAGGGPGENEMGTFFQLASANSASVVLSFLEALPD